MSRWANSVLGESLHAGGGGGGSLSYDSAGISTREQSLSEMHIHPLRLPLPWSLKESFATWGTQTDGHQGSLEPPLP